MLSLRYAKGRGKVESKFVHLYSWYCKSKQTVTIYNSNINLCLHRRAHVALFIHNIPVVASPSVCDCIFTDAELSSFRLIVISLLSSWQDGCVCLIYKYKNDFVEIKRM